MGMTPRSMTIVPGSVGMVAQRDGVAIAESLLNAHYMAIVDVSGSMAVCDSRGGRSRHQVAQEELTKLQAAHPGDIAVVAFSDDTEFCPNGVLPQPIAGTDLAGALRWAQPFDGTMSFIVVSDGVPDAPSMALDVARQFVSRIDTVFVGPEDDRAARAFMQQLALAGHGHGVLAKHATELAAQVETLLLK